MAVELSPGVVLVLAPSGRDAAVIASLLRPAGIASEVVLDFAAAVAKAPQAAGLAVTEEAFLRLESASLLEWVEEQPPWSDFPVILLRARGAAEVPKTQRLIDRLGNVTVLERPLHPTTLIAAARSAERAR
ncbi:MAG TPA: PAS domain-containing sensor histidine kinase, partial [Caulobacteraceae bacterium]|nr:PAS domain-containing sensor histidine kinase [Caulobacteraceae bacterium]